MNALRRLDALLDRGRDLSALPIRLVVGFILIYGTQDNVFDSARMNEFAQFLAVRQVPSPLFGAFLSAYAQFGCGLLILAGLWTRLAAAVMVINFAAAIMIAHLGQPFERNIGVLLMLACSVSLALHGPGRCSLDQRLATRRARV